MILTPSPLRHLNTIGGYEAALYKLRKLPDAEKIPIYRRLARTDLFFLLWFVLGRKDISHPWLLARCKEVEINPNGYLDLWARDHYKSTIITFGKSIQDILASHGNDVLPEWKDREITIGIFSASRPLAKGFLRQIKVEFETNGTLKELFPDIFWENTNDAPKWSEDDGIVVKRKTNPKEATIEAWGLIDAQPTGKHFFLRVYDDMVTLDYVQSPEMIKKTRVAWEMSTNLGTNGGIVRYIGTRYHYNDCYNTMMERQSAIPRIHAATENGQPTGAPVFLSHQVLQKKRTDQGPITFATQMLLNPILESLISFKWDWLRYAHFSRQVPANTYITVDPASSQKKGSDYTVMWVISCGSDGNYYIRDIIRDRLSLTQRTEELFRLVARYRPLAVGYEQYSMQADIEHIQYRMQQISYHFKIIPLGGKLKKEERIKRLIPDFEQGRIFLPNTLVKKDYEGKHENLIDIFVKEEYIQFPTSQHDDMLDALARIKDEDLGVTFPLAESEDDYFAYNYQYRPNNQVTGY
jgi:predicted phage terminase large subunit-like protein